ncbi:MAG TPA: hypothetical protein VMT70_09075, partial [Vicinamibacteria bacterium]|nr:hypothetical protein [Vicinamibacteria bacterium]
MTRFAPFLRLGAAVLLSSLGAGTARAATFVVDRTDDLPDNNPGNGQCSVGGGPPRCTLRAAIMEANASAGADVINFNIGGGGPQTIVITSPLPPITGVVTIDGTTQPGFVNAAPYTPVITVDGSAVAGSGLVLAAGSSGSTIRGLAIYGFSGATHAEIEINASATNLVVGNRLCVDRTGTVAMGGWAGVLVTAGSTGNTIGGTTAANRNIISGAATDGVQISVGGTSNNVVTGNYIGLDVNGTTGLGNAAKGVAIWGGASNNTVGGTAAGAGNVISGNNLLGVEISDAGTTGNLVQGNRIGTDVSGTLNRGNTSYGVRLRLGATGNSIGGAAAGAGNTIAYSGLQGIVVTESATVGDSILGNSIYSNGGLGIDLNDDGVTANDTGDVDTGPNNLQNFPVLSAAMTNGTQATFAGSYSATAAVATYRIEFFASAAADPTGYGEGQRYLGFTNVTTNAAGSAVIAATLVPAVPLANGELVTATATDAANNTSEFGNAVAAVNHLVVTTTSDAADGITTSVANLIANPGADGRISLREAILAANATAGADTITFGIPLTDANHYYYRDNGGAGFSAEVTTTLADVASASSPAIPDFDANYPPGLARSWYRIQPGSAYAAMTGPTTLDATTQRGYLVGGPVVEVVGNLAGTGVRPFLVTVGTATSTFRGFVVNRFAREAFSFGATGTVVQGNYVGTDVSGTIARGNGTDGTGAGIYVGGANSQIGGLNPGDRNVISADGDWGLFIDAQNVVVCGNYIGTDVTGTVALGNTKGGIDLFNGANPSTNNTIGGTVAGARNVISGNVGPGIRISEGGTVNSNTIKGNSIGTNAAGTGSLPNNQQGILVSSGTTGNLIFLNTIADNTLAGVAVVGATTTGNAILTNAIYGNGALGIDLNNDGVTANDAGDGDAGPNDLQNYPVLGAAVTDGASSAYFTGTLNSTANATFRVEFFASAAPDPSGFGEGQRFLAFTSVTTNGAGNAAFNVALPATLAAGEYVTATATNPANSTSEFSASVVATAVNLVTVGTGCTGGKVPTGANFVVHGAFDGGATPAANNFTTSVWNGGICPNDTGETIRTTTGNCGGLNVAITQFPGDPAAGIAGTPDSLYANGNNTFPVGGPAPYQPYLVWRQTVTGLTQNTTYTFYVYASNANNGAVVQPGILPTLRFCMGVTGGPPYGCATTLTAADFAIPNETAATGDVWGRYQVSFTTGAGQTTADLAILDAATNTNGDDVQITRIGVQACGLPTAVELMSFTATGRDRAVDLAWQTGSELDNLGFNLYRSSSSSGPWTRLNASLIPGLGSSPLGAAYSWRDSGLVNGQRYSYRLEDVDTRSVSTFHGPISAVPQAVAPGDGGGPSGGSGGSGPSPSSSSCPSWVLAASGFSPGESETPPSCQSYGDPSLTSLRVVSQSLQGAVLELETSGFVAMREGSGSVRAFIPGFDLPTEASSAALPMRRAVVDAVVGRGVRLESVEALSLEHFPGLWPGAVGKAGIEVTADGTVRPSRRPVRMSSVGRGMVPGDWARLGGAVFQGETKRAVVEITPLRFDASRSELVLARRVFVKLSFTGVEGGERGSGRLGRRVPGGAARSSEALAELYTTGRGLYAISFSDLFLERRRGMDVSLLSLERQGVAVPFHVEPDEPVFGPGSILYFYSDHVSSSPEYSAETAYELVRSGVGVRMGVGVGAPHGSAVAPGSRGTRSYETNRIYQAGLLEAPDPWLWEALGGGITRT